MKSDLKEETQQRGCLGACAGRRRVGQAHIQGTLVDGTACCSLLCVLSAMTIANLPALFMS